MLIILFNMPYFSEEINGKNVAARIFLEKVIGDNLKHEEKEEDFRLPLTLAW